MPAVTHTYSPATPAQISYATTLAAQKGFRHLSQAEKACFGKSKIGGLKRGDVSRLIDWLKA